MARLDWLTKDVKVARWLYELNVYITECIAWPFFSLAIYGLARSRVRLISFIHRKLLATNAYYYYNKRFISLCKSQDLWCFVTWSLCHLYCYYCQEFIIHRKFMFMSIVSVCCLTELCNGIYNWMYVGKLEWEKLVNRKPFTNF